MSQTKVGHNLRWYYQGQAVGMGKMTMLKPDTSRGLDPVKEAGNDDVVEYAPKIKETTLALGYNVIHKRALADAMGQTTTASTSINVPEIPENFDVVERRLKQGTALTGHYGPGGLWISDEIVEGYTIYQRVAWEKDSYDQEVDKIVSRALSAKGNRPLDFEGIVGIQFDRFTGNGRRAAFTLSIPGKTVARATGQRMIRVEAPYFYYLTEGVDYTLTYPQGSSSDAGVNIMSITSSGTPVYISGGAGPQFLQQDVAAAVINFIIPPPSSAVANILAVYAY